MTKALIITLSLLLYGTPAISADLPPTRGEVINIVQWDGGALPPIYERSNQLPFTREDLKQLAQNDFPAGQIAQMVAERRFVGDASADGLIALRNDGLPHEVIQAVSKHALPPNRALNLSVELTFEGETWAARKRYLYVIIPDGTINRIFTADLNDVLSGHWKNDVITDQTDPMLARKIRHITFVGSVPLKTHGQKTVHMFTSTRPGIQHVTDIPKPDLDGVKTYTIDYPASSLLQDCRIQVRYKQDVMLPEKWQMIDANLECEWN